MKKTVSFITIFILSLLLLACSNDSIMEEWSDNSPFFKHELGEMFGKEGSIGIIGMKDITENGQKWMWHFWGNPDIAYKDWEVQARQEGDEEFISPLIFNDDSLEPRGEEINGHARSTVLFPSSGLWELNVYIDGEFFDQLTVDVDQE
ncbi:DUF4871 domain-containing protein [Alkalicoccobacillus gibsonii]|uniref:DUF4871 domain-containing protein n=1 Tax=Alkalicoccobacillus gibsonii TaxID=79881 RepID=A0ABU9VD88_9BACI